MKVRYFFAVKRYLYDGDSEAIGGKQDKTVNKVQVGLHNLTSSLRKCNDVDVNFLKCYFLRNLPGTLHKLAMLQTTTAYFRPLFTITVTVIAVFLKATSVVACSYSESDVILHEGTMSTIEVEDDCSWTLRGDDDDVTALSIQFTDVDMSCPEESNKNCTAHVLFKDDKGEFQKSCSHCFSVVYTKTGHVSHQKEQSDQKMSESETENCEVTYYNVTELPKGFLTHGGANRDCNEGSSYSFHVEFSFKKNDKNDDITSGIDPEKTTTISPTMLPEEMRPNASFTITLNQTTEDFAHSPAIESFAIVLIVVAVLSQTAWIVVGYFCWQHYRSKPLFRVLDQGATESRHTSVNSIHRESVSYTQTHGYQECEIVVKATYGRNAHVATVHVETTTPEPRASSTVV